MGDFQTQFVIKKMATVTLNKANNFTVDLNQLGLGYWEKGKIDVFSSVKNMTLSRYCAGYSLEAIDIGTINPIYKVQVQKMCNKHSYKTSRTSGHPQTSSFVLGKTTFMASIFMDYTGGINQNAGIWCKKNDEILFDDTYIKPSSITNYYGWNMMDTGFCLKEYEEEVIITGGWKYSVDVNQPFTFEVKEFYTEEIDDKDVEIVCIFLHK